MATFVELNSAEKNCRVIVNLDHIVEIAPLVDGGCVLFMSDSAGMNSRQGIRVTDKYDQFLQFAMQTVTAEDIARRFPKVEKSDKAETKNSGKKSEPVAFDIPKL